MSVLSGSCLLQHGLLVCPTVLLLLSDRCLPPPPPAAPDSKVTSVKVSNRLDVTPCVVVTGQYGNSANMERIQRYQVRACVWLGCLTTSPSAPVSRPGPTGKPAAH